MSPDSKDILGVKVDFGLNRAGVMDIIEKKFLTDGKSHMISTTNPEFVMEAQTDPEFREIINKSDLSVPDGNGLLYAKYYLNYVLKFKKDSLFGVKNFLYGTGLGLSSFFINYDLGEAVSGVDLTNDICKLSSEKGYSVFFLGGKARDSKGKHYDTSFDLATMAAEKVRKKYPNVNIIGATSKFYSNTEQDDATIEYVRQCMSKHGIHFLDFLFVAYTSPNQEKWVARNKDKIPARVCMGVGSTFDYLAEYYKLAPDFIRKSRLEWLYKLFYQPWRYKRISRAFPQFPFEIFKYANKLS